MLSIIILLTGDTFLNTNAIFFKYYKMEKQVLIG